MALVAKDKFMCLRNRVLFLNFSQWYTPGKKRDQNSTSFTESGIYNYSIRIWRRFGVATELIGRSLQATSYGGLKGKLTPVWPNAHFFEKNIWSALLIFQKQFLI